MTLPRSSGFTRTSSTLPRRSARLRTRTSSGYWTMPRTRCSRASSSTSGLSAGCASRVLLGGAAFGGAVGRGAIGGRFGGYGLGRGAVGRRFGGYGPGGGAGGRAVRREAGARGVGAGGGR